MTPYDALRFRRDELTGRVTSESDVADIESRVAPHVLPAWLKQAMTELPLAGTCFVLPNDEPETIGFGDAMVWLDTSSIIFNLFEAEQDVPLLQGNYFPIGEGWCDEDGLRIHLADAFCIKLPEPNQPADQPTNGAVPIPLMNISHESGPDSTSDLLVHPDLVNFIKNAQIVPRAASGQSN